MKRISIALFVLVMPGVSVAAPPTHLDELRAKCEKEKVSLFRSNNGTPNCDRLAKELQNPPKNDQASYRWNGSLGKYCYYNEEGAITSCSGG